MTTSTNKLLAAREKVTVLRKTRPVNKAGSKFADINDIFEDARAAALITTTVDEIIQCKEAMKMLSEEIKGHERSMQETFGLNPKVLRVLVTAQTTSVLDELSEAQAAVQRVYGADQSDKAGYA